MEHIVQFGIGIDDESIKKRVEEYAYDDIVKQLVQEAKDSLPRIDAWRRNSGQIDWRYLVEEQLQVFCENHKDEVIELAAEKLAESFKRTKAYKTRMAEVIESENI